MDRTHTRRGLGCGAPRVTSFELDGNDGAALSCWQRRAWTVPEVIESVSEQ